MTLKIEVEVPYDAVQNNDAARYLSRALLAIGFVRAGEVSISSDETINKRDAEVDAAVRAAVCDVLTNPDVPYAEKIAVVQRLVPPEDITEDELASAVEKLRSTQPPARKRGEPSPGKSRRTKAEIAEDDAADKADAARQEAAVDANIQAEGADDVKAAISTGENRVGPDDEQDDADEAAEVEANRKGLTHDDLRQAVGRYQKKFGMAAAVAGIPALLGCAIVEVAEADLAAAIAKVDNAVAGDAPGPVEDAAPAAAEKPVEKPATKDDVMAAMLRYAKKFDGQSEDMNAMPHTMADAPKIFGLLFGEGVVKLSQVPADGYAKTVAAFDEAIAKNPFKR